MDAIIDRASGWKIGILSLSTVYIEQGVFYEQSF
jgi:hypothetical protein